MKGFQVLTCEREGTAARGYVRQSGAVYRFEVLADDTITLCRMQGDGTIASRPARAPKTEAMLRKTLKETQLDEETFEPKPVPR